MLALLPLFTATLTDKEKLKLSSVFYFSVMLRGILFAKNVMAFHFISLLKKKKMELHSQLFSVTLLIEQL